MGFILSNNYAQIGGKVFETNPAETPFLTSIGLNTNGEGKFPQGFSSPETIMNVKGGTREIAWKSYTGRDPAIPADKENQEIPTADFTNEEQLTNPLHIFDNYSIKMSKYAEATAGEQRKSDGTQLDNNSALLNPKDIDILTKATIRKIQDFKKDVEKTFLYSSKVAPTNPSVTAPQMQGLFNWVPSANKIDVAGGPLLEGHINTMCSILADNFALGSGELIIMCSYTTKQNLSKMYGVAPRDRKVGGIDIDTLEINGFKIGVMVNPWLKVYGKADEAIVYNPDNFEPIGTDLYDDFGNAGKVIIEKVPTTKSAREFRMMALLSLLVMHPNKLVSFDGLPLV